MDLIDMPQVKATLFISGTEFPLQDFTNQVNIMPTRVRTKEDWPQSIKESKDLPEHLKPRCVWSYSIEEQNCTDINIVMEKLTKIFCSEGERINIFRNNYALELGVEIVIHAKIMSMPAINLKSKDIVFWGSLGANISFDIYIYYEELDSECKIN